MWKKLKWYANFVHNKFQKFLIKGLVFYPLWLNPPYLVKDLSFSCFFKPSLTLPWWKWFYYFDSHFGFGTMRKRKDCEFLKLKYIQKKKYEKYDERKERSNWSIVHRKNQILKCMQYTFFFIRAPFIITPRLKLWKK